MQFIIVTLTTFWNDYLYYIFQHIPVPVLWSDMLFYLDTVVLNFLSYKNTLAGIQNNNNNSNKHNTIKKNAFYEDVWDNNNTWTALGFLVSSSVTWRKTML